MGVEAELVDEDPVEEPDPEAQAETFDDLVTGITGESRFEQNLRDLYTDLEDWV